MKTARWVAQIILAGPFGSAGLMKLLLLALVVASSASGRIRSEAGGEFGSITGGTYHGRHG